MIPIPTDEELMDIPEGWKVTASAARYDFEDGIYYRYVRITLIDGHRELAIKMVNVDYVTDPESVGKKFREFLENEEAELRTSEANNL